MTARLNVNIDHVATVRQARRAMDPNVIAAALICEMAGADGITIHLRGDRRHIQDADLKGLRLTITTYLNVEMAASEEMVGIAIENKPDAVTLVAENPNEITTEGGLDVKTNIGIVRAAVLRLREGGINTSLFVDPDLSQIEAAREVGAQQVELCTAVYSELTQSARVSQRDSAMRAIIELRRLREAAALAGQYGLRVAAGHGLTYKNVGAVAAIEEISEFNIGHNIIARSVFVGLAEATREMRDAIAGGAK